MLAATSFADRTRGLLGQDTLAGTGLWLNPSQGIHTFGMRFPIDVVALDRHHRVVALAVNVRPWRIAGLHFRTRSILELPAGSADLAGVTPGDFLDLHLQTGP